MFVAHRGAEVGSRYGSSLRLGLGTPTVEVASNSGWGLRPVLKEPVEFAVFCSPEEGVDFVPVEGEGAAVGVF